MGDARQHAADLGPVGQHVALPDPPQAEGAQGGAGPGLGPDGGADLGHREGGPRRGIGHHATSTGTAAPRLRSRKARSTPAGVTSSGDFPRSRATTSGSLRPRRAATVAWATLILLEEPSDLHSTSLMPAISRMARAAPPAMTPVPGAAGLSRTRPAPASPMISWGIVVPASGTENRFFLASSTALVVASGVSLALP